MKLIDLIEHISESDDTGLLKIKPFSEVDYHRFKAVVVYKTASVNSARHGEMTFSDDVWRDPNRSVNFTTLSGAIKFEVKSAFLLANYTGLFEGGNGIKFSSACQQIAPLIKFGELIQAYNIDSIASFNSLPALIKRNYFIKLLKDKLGLADKKMTFNHKFFAENLNYGLFTADSLAIFSEELAKFNITTAREEKPRSYPIVPSALLQKVIGECEIKFAEANNIIGQWQAANHNYVDAIRNTTDTGIQHSYASAIVNKKPHLNQLVAPLREGFRVLNNLKLHVLLYILAYTGMRKEEALSCTLGCASQHDGKYYVEAVLTKADDTKTTMKWVANQDTYHAIAMLERYVKAMHQRASAILENPQIKLTAAFEHQLRHGLHAKLLFGVVDNLTSIKFSDVNLGTRTSSQAANSDGKEPKFSLHRFEYALSTQDLDQLESLGCNAKSVRGYNIGEKYVEGEIFHITPHMLRHNFAWFIIANRLGELDDIKHQFKHLASSMTMVYAARGYESPDEMIGLFEDFEALLVNNIAQNIATQAAAGTLTGEAGKRLNKGAKNLIFNVTAADGSNTGRIVKQLHFKSLDAYKIFLAENLTNIRGLPHGYCTAGPACKLKNVGLPSGCVYCPSYLVTEQQRVHWQAMKNFADQKLGFYNQLSAEQQQEYSLLAQSWRDTSNAAKVILTDKTPLKVKGAIA